MTKKIISSATVPFITLERIRQDVCKIGVVFFNGLAPLDVTGVAFEFSVFSGTYRVIHKTNEQLIRTASNRLEVTLTDSDKAKLINPNYQVQLRRTSQQVTELIGDLVFIRGSNSQASGLQTPPDILIRYVNGQPDPEATILVIQGPQGLTGNITQQLEQLRADTIAAKNEATGAAQTATTKASLANDAAGAAAGSAQTASNKAGQANDAANAAAQSATNATNAAMTMALIFG